MRRFLPALIHILLFAASAKAHAIDSAAWLRIFLTPGDLPGLMHGQDSRWRETDDDDSIFVRMHGIQSGMNIWNSELDSTGANSWTRIVDIHWLFPDSATVREYFERTLVDNSEQAPEIYRAKQVGEASHAYGGTLRLAGFTMKNFYYLFVQGRVVTKLFLNQSNTLADPTRFTVDDAYRVAAVLADRVRRSGI